MKTPGLSEIEGPQRADPECCVNIACLCGESLKDSARSDTSLRAEAKGEDASLCKGKGKQCDPWV